jgi:hypothetical protein
VISNALSTSRAAVRALAATVLVTLALVPSIARAHDRFSPVRTPAQEHARFRWTNSCEAVPQKVTTVVAVAPIESPAQASVDPPPPRPCAFAATDLPLPASSSIRSPLGLRAPPSSVR